MPGGFSLRRWSRRKLEAARESKAAVAPPAPAVPDASASPSTASLPVAVPLPGEAPALPPIESLTPDSDFTAFMQPKVDDGVRRQALKKLFADPHFNVMDGLDVYIDDYSKPDPIAPGVLERLAQMGFVRDAGAAAETAPPTAASIPERAMPAPETPQGAQLSEVAAPALPANAPDASVDPVAAEKSPQVRPEP